ncbi:MAG: M28 family peptidase [Chloroflexota bacterium]|nr:M28 family peptidase [Chloroflexota bacterium]
MNINTNQALDFLSRLGAQPAISFYEEGVLSVIKTILMEIGVQHTVDLYGNIIAKIEGEAAHLEPGVAFMAHTDHPGFEAISEMEPGTLIGVAMGGVPAGSFEQEIPLQVLQENGERIKAFTCGRTGTDEERQILIKLITPQPVQLPCAVVFDLEDFELDGEFIRMRALDDLAGCGSILAMLSMLSESRPVSDVYGIFTRAEEVGLVGARLLAESGLLDKSAIIVSLESSRVLPGAEQGKGPVIRVGDAAFTFNGEAESILIKAREELRKEQDGFAVQRQLMSGGTCEASAFALYEYQTTGIAFPLGNYHNGTPEGGIGVEYIHRQDYFGGIQLMVESVRQIAGRHDTGFRNRLGVIDIDQRNRLTI